MIEAYRIGAILVAVVAVMTAIYLKGQRDGRDEQLRDSVEAFETRGKIDDETGNLDPRGLCLRLGGVPKQCDELRGMAKASGSQ